MEDQTPTTEGTAVPTPDNGMSPQDSAPKVETRPTKSPELKVIEEALGREFDTLDDAKKTLTNLNSLVGDQTVSKQRKTLEKLAQQANLTTDELIEVIATQDVHIPQGTEETQPTPAPRNLPDESTRRLVRLETDTFVKDYPDAAIIRDQLFAEALATGKTASDLWTLKYAPIVEAAVKKGAKKLQANLEGQPTRATSTASESTDTQVDFKKMSAKDMEKYLGYADPSARI